MISNKLIESELLKLNKHRITLETALNTICRDQGKFETVIRTLGDELVKLEDNLKYLKDPNTNVISLTDFKKIEEETSKLKKDIKAAEKQLDAIRGFRRLTEVDLEGTIIEILKLEKFKERSAKIYQFKKDK